MRLTSVAVSEQRSRTSCCRQERSRFFKQCEVAVTVDWATWEATWKKSGVIVDRPRGSSHPRYSKMIYPIDYGHIPSTVGGDDEEVDVFVGRTATGIVGAIFTKDALKGNEEMKLLINMSKEEIYRVYEFEAGTSSLIGRMSLVS
jgi:inorganic pyrophosphatase